MSAGLMHAWALGITLVLEVGGVGLYLLTTRFSARQAVRGIFLALGLNLLTHTLFWYSFPWLPLAYVPRLWLCEGLIALTEAAAYRRGLAFAWAEALAVGCVLNLLSALAGLIWWQTAFGLGG